MTFPAKPFKNCYWLLPHLILAGDVPVGGDEAITRKKIESLLDAGIRVFISLLYDEPFAYQDILQKVSEKRGIQTDYFQFPIRDMGIPDESLMKKIIDLIDRSVAQKKPVYYHCYAGLGRTGIVSCCWLIRNEKLEGMNIFKRLNTIRKEQNHMAYWESPQSQEQYDFVFAWNEGPL